LYSSAAENTSRASSSLLSAPACEAKNRGGQTFAPALRGKLNCAQNRAAEHQATRSRDHVTVDRRRRRAVRTTPDHTRSHTVDREEEGKPGGGGGAVPEGAAAGGAPLFLPGAVAAEAASLVVPAIGVRPVRKVPRRSRCGAEGTLALYSPWNLGARGAASERL
jgi:hypothetical protein